MKILNSKSGMTLVEIVLSILILSIGSLMLASGFSTSARLNTRARHLRNSSVAASSSLEVEQAMDSSDPDVEINYDVKSSNALTIKYKVGNEEKTFIQKGQYAIANDTKGSNVGYKEFYPSNYIFDVDATPTGD